jgi:hypothetical protein
MAVAARYAFRGMVAAMAMTGVRRVTTGFGLLEEAPPEKMAKEAPIVADLVDEVPPRHRDEVVELAHWAYGALCGALYGMAVAPRVRTPVLGPVYGLAVWAVYETGIVPLFGLTHARERTIASRVVVAVDHALYGAIVGDSI